MYDIFNKSYNKFVINFTKEALDKIESVYDEEKYNGVVCLRVQIKGGGCSGFMYDLYFDDKGQRETDDVTSIIPDQVNIIIDPISEQYLNGTTIDFVSTLMNEGFKFENPNASGKCGCGNSVAF